MKIFLILFIKITGLCSSYPIPLALSTKKITHNLFITQDKDYISNLFKIGFFLKNETVDSLIKNSSKVNDVRSDLGDVGLLQFAINRQDSNYMISIFWSIKFNKIGLIKLSPMKQLSDLYTKNYILDFESDTFLLLTNAGYLLDYRVAMSDLYIYSFNGNGNLIKQLFSDVKNLISINPYTVDTFIPEHAKNSMEEKIFINKGGKILWPDRLGGYIYVDTLPKKRWLFNFFKIVLVD